MQIMYMHIHMHFAWNDITLQGMNDKILGLQKQLQHLGPMSDYRKPSIHTWNMSSSKNAVVYYGFPHFVAQGKICIHLTCRC